MRDRLEPGGVVVVNAGHPEGSTRLEEMLAAGVRERVPARRARPDHGVQHAADRERRRPPPAPRAAAAAVRPTCAPCSPQAAARLGGRAGRRAYTDDKAPVEWLIDRSIVSYAAGGGSG